MSNLKSKSINVTFAFQLQSVTSGAGNFLKILARQGIAVSTLWKNSWIGKNMKVLKGDSNALKTILARNMNMKMNTERGCTLQGIT